jgi:sterol desaturase/sphingolipid hydroxylase (fatty acid hydroxylase superfamily)
MNNIKDSNYGIRDKRGHWSPFKKVDINPQFLKPFHFSKFLFKFIKDKFILGSIQSYIFLATPIICWLFISPSLETTKNFEINWILFIFFRNLLIILIFFGFYHLRLYTFNTQGNQFKYNPKTLDKKNPKFFMRNQLIDNLFYTLFWGVPIWTFYEILSLWAYANNIINYVKWEDAPIYCLTVLLLVTTFQGAQFYLVHRLLHWKPLYKYVHSIHHRNVNTGPFSGLSFHPVEHLLFFSGIFLFWLIPSNPIIAMWYLFFSALSPIGGHSGYERMIFKNGKSIPSGDYNHYLHHKYFECNYAGGGVSILDEIFGTFHDGSNEATKKIMARIKNKAHYL